MGEAHSGLGLKAGEIDLNGFAAVNRGGNWNNASNAGLATANLNDGPGNRNSNIGFRAAAL